MTGSPLSDGLDPPLYGALQLNRCLSQAALFRSNLVNTLMLNKKTNYHVEREKRIESHQNRPTSQITQPVMHKKTKNKWHAFTVKEVKGTITAEEALRYTYKLIFKQDLKEIRGWELFTEREGLMQMGRYGTISKFFGPSPFSFYRTYFWQNNKKPSQNSEGLLKLN